MFTRSYESMRPEEFKVSITTDCIDLYTANVPAHLQYKEHVVLLSYSLRSKIEVLVEISTMDHIQMYPDTF